MNKLKIYDAKEVTNNFGKFYTNLGKDLADSINTDGIILNEYLSKIEINLKTIYLNPITAAAIIKYINNLPAENSSGYDNISNNFLKQVKYSIIEPLTHIFNLSRLNREFLEQMKLAEIIPCSKKEKTFDSQLQTNIPNYHSL